LDNQSISWEQISILHLTDVSDDNLFDWNLFNNIISDDVEFLVEFNFRLKTSELPFFRPIIESRDKHNYNNSDDDSGAFNPLDIRLL
jgi:hypothetical protein